jgi:predicted membrane GTPase involved in stress response
VHQQDRQAGRAPRRSAQRGVRPVRRLDATDEQLDFPILYGSGQERLDAEKPDGPKDQGDMAPLFDLVREARAPPTVETARSACSAPPSSSNPFLGRISPAASPPAR